MLKKEEKNQKKKYKKEQQIKNKGITLIALVITIIVLLILAGVSINILIGENGLLTKSQDAVDENKRGGARDKVATSVYASYNTNYNPDNLKLKIDEEALKTNIEKAGGKIVSAGEFPVTVEMDGYKFIVDDKGNIDKIIPIGYKISKNENEDSVKEGLVIRDGSGNEYVWIEVPQTEEVYEKTRLDITNFTEENYETIEKDLRNYSNNPYNTAGMNGCASGGDEWYALQDGTIVTNDQAAGLTDDQKALDTGCGLNYNEYYELKKRMLKSIYQNGGFWVGRYEAGIEGSIEKATPRTKNTSTDAKAVSQQDKYPYNFVACSQAQKLASEMKVEGSEVTSSLMFGVQWNLVCKFIEKNVTILGESIDVVKALSADSRGWGNYNQDEFEINRGKYLTDSWKPYTEDTTDIVINKVKKNGQSVLLTTGASERNKVLNIYDFAGNEYEWTLEKTNDPSYLGIARGGCCNNAGGSNRANYCVGGGKYRWYEEIKFSFRVSLY